MKARITDRSSLSAIAPAVLSAYARSEGWETIEEYGGHSDVYSAQGLPEIIIPRTTTIGDYPEVVSQLLQIFSETASMDEIVLYRDLVTGDRDVVRVRALESDDGSIPLHDGVNLVGGSARHASGRGLFS